MGEVFQQIEETEIAPAPTEENPAIHSTQATEMLPARPEKQRAFSVAGLQELERRLKNLKSIPELRASVQNLDTPFEDVLHALEVLAIRQHAIPKSDGSGEALDAGVTLATLRKVKSAFVQEDFGQVNALLRTVTNSWNLRKKLYADLETTYAALASLHDNPITFAEELDRVEPLFP